VGARRQASPGFSACFAGGTLAQARRAWRRPKTRRGVIFLVFLEISVV